MVLAATYTVPERIYTEPDQFGHRRLLHPQGKKISWNEALALGLVSDDVAPPPESVEVRCPRNVYEGVGPVRRLVHRVGSTISLAEYERLFADGVDDVTEVVVVDGEVQKTDEAPAESEAPPTDPAGQPSRERKVRTTEVPAPAPAPKG